MWSNKFRRVDQSPQEKCKARSNDETRERDDDDDVTGRSTDFHNQKKMLFRIETSIVSNDHSYTDDTFSWSFIPRRRSKRSWRNKEERIATEYGNERTKRAEDVPVAEKCPAHEFDHETYSADLGANVAHSVSVGVDVSCSFPSSSGAESSFTFPVSSSPPSNAQDGISRCFSRMKKCFRRWTSNCDIVSEDVEMCTVVDDEHVFKNNSNCLKGRKRTRSTKRETGARGDERSNASRKKGRKGNDNTGTRFEEKQSTSADKTRKSVAVVSYQTPPWAVFPIDDDEPFYDSAFSRSEDKNPTMSIDEYLTDSNSTPDSPSVHFSLNETSPSTIAQAAKIRGGNAATEVAMMATESASASGLLVQVRYHFSALLGHRGVGRHICMFLVSDDVLRVSTVTWQGRQHIRSWMRDVGIYVSLLRDREAPRVPRDMLKRSGAATFEAQQKRVTVGDVEEVVEWMITIGLDHSFCLETIMRSVALLHRLCGKKVLSGADALWIFGSTCVLCAAKFDEVVWPLPKALNLWKASRTLRRVMRRRPALWVSKKFCSAEKTVLQVMDYDIGFATPSFFANLNLVTNGPNAPVLAISRRLCLIYLRCFRFRTLPPSHVGQKIATIAKEYGTIEKYTALEDAFLRRELETRLSEV